MYPDLSEPYATALRSAVDFVHERFDPTGILASGTIVRGNPHPSSDLDIVVTHPHPWRQRIQRRFNAIPAELFVNPPFALERAMDTDRARGRPVIAHMLATGVVLLDTENEFVRLQEHAHRALARGPSWTQEQLTQHRYGIATLFEDATDIAGIDPELAATFLADAVLSSVRLMFLRDNRWLPRQKLLLAEFSRRYPEWGENVRSAMRPQPIAARIELAAPFVQHAAGATGFFEWESEPQILNP